MKSSVGENFQVILIENEEKSTRPDEHLIVMRHESRVKRIYEEDGRRGLR
jgi:hypothetical protein